MALSPKLIRRQLELFRPIITGCSIETSRRGQEILGSIMFAGKKHVTILPHDLSSCDGFWVYPDDETKNGVILYLHGGGFVSGDTEYSKGFSSVLAVNFGVRVYSIAYRLAPENPYPAALDDALEAYRYLLFSGYSPKRIILCGESAGGGLIYSLAQFPTSTS